MGASTVPSEGDEIDFDALPWAPGCGPQSRRPIPRFVREPGGLNWWDAQVCAFKYKTMADNGVIPF